LGDALKMQTTLREGPAAGCAELPHRPPVGAVTLAGLVVETDGSGGTVLRVHWVNCARRFETCLFRLEGPKCP